MSDQNQIVLSADDVELARELAHRTFAMFATNRGYYRNTPNSHLIGKVGELCAQRWLENAGLLVEPWFASDERQTDADLECNGHRIEVKTWDSRWWPKWGRCVATGQAQALAAKADCVMWMSVATSDGTPVTGILCGWSTIDDVLSAPVLWTGPAGRQVRNHQLAVDSIRSLSSLSADLRKQAPSPDSKL